MKEKFIVLTKSSKRRNLCVAGVRSNGTWIRIVTDNADTDGAIPWWFMKNANILDCVQVEILCARPTAMQPENQLVNTSVPLLKVANESLQNVLKIHPAERRDNIFGNNSHVIPASIIDRSPYSLTLIYVQNLHLYLNEKHHTGADFSYNGNFYQNMSVTDPEFYNIKEDTMPAAYIVVSLANQPCYGYYYKFVSKIFLS